jgi:hypothetical protein
VRGRPNGTPLARREAAASTGSKPDLSEQGQSPARFGMQSTASGSRRREVRQNARSELGNEPGDRRCCWSPMRALRRARSKRCWRRGATASRARRSASQACSPRRWGAGSDGGAAAPCWRRCGPRAPGVQRVVAALPEAPGFDGASWTPSPARAGPTSSPAHPGWWSWPTRSAMANGSCGCPARGTSRRRAAARWRTWGALARHRRQGRVVRVPSESFDVAGLFPAAPDVIGGPVRVRAVTPLVYRVFTPSRAHSKAASPRPSPMGCWREGRRPATTRPSPAEAATLRA